jgi:hypothetical protein
MGEEYSSLTLYNLCVSLPKTLMSSLEDSVTCYPPDPPYVAPTQARWRTIEHLPQGRQPVHQGRWGQCPRAPDPSWAGAPREVLGESFLQGAVKTGREKTREQIRKETGSGASAGLNAQKRREGARWCWAAEQRWQRRQQSPLAGRVPSPNPHPAQQIDTGATGMGRRRPNRRQEGGGGGMEQAVSTQAHPGTGTHAPSHALAQTIRTRTQSAGTPVDARRTGHNEAAHAS